MPKQLILIRHAHRDKPVPDADNGLSKKGRAQADALLAHFKSEIGREEVALYSSPKRRCIETLEPIAGYLKTRITVEALLDEQGARESHRDLDHRVASAWEKMRQSSEERVIFCSHGDWLPAFLQIATGLARVDFKKGGWAELSLDQGQATLLSLFPRLA